MADEHHPERPPYGIVPASDTLGLWHVEVALRDLPFPATRRDLVGRAGQWRMPITGAHFHRLEEFLEGVPDRRFRSPHDVARAIARAHPELKP